MATLISPVWNIVLGIVKYAIFLLLVNHYLGCMWWFVGTYKGVHSEADDIHGREGWTSQDFVKDRSPSYKYLTSIHWSLSQFQGQSEIEVGSTWSERAYAAWVLVFALFICAWIISCLTSLIMELRSLGAESATKNRHVRQFLISNGIGLRNSMQVRKYANWKLRHIHRLNYQSEVL